MYRMITLWGDLSQGGLGNGVSPSPELASAAPLNDGSTLVPNLGEYAGEYQQKQALQLQEMQAHTQDANRFPLWNISL